MGTTVNRSPSQMRKFADDIDEYSTEMRKICMNFKNCAASAAPYMKDESSKKALARLEILSEEIVKGLPAAEDISERLKKSARALEDALAIQMT